MREYSDYKFSFEKLEVYQKAMEFTDKIFNITLRFRKEIQYSLGDQFRRAALSVCNNLAEGSDKQTKNAKIQFYGYALDSARECIPMLTLSLKQKQITNEINEDLRSRCIHICNMISKLILSTK